jgi:hypothetical protein
VRTERCLPPVSRENMLPGGGLPSLCFTKYGRTWGCESVNTDKSLLGRGRLPRADHAGVGCTEEGDPWSSRHIYGGVTCLEA